MSINQSSTYPFQILHAKHQASKNDKTTRRNSTLVDDIRSKNVCKVKSFWNNLYIIIYTTHL